MISIKLLWQRDDQNLEGWNTTIIHILFIVNRSQELSSVYITSHNITTESNEESINVKNLLMA